MKIISNWTIRMISCNIVITLYFFGKKKIVSWFGRRVARIWKRGGLFWKSEKSANVLDPNFHCSWISFLRFVQKFIQKLNNFSESSEIPTFFPPKIRWSPKKKGLHRNWDYWFFGRNRKFKRLKGGLFSYGGGLFSVFDKKSAWPQKHQKRAILHTSLANGGGSSPPAPPSWLRYCDLVN